jgi:hypothetical protein
MSLQVACFCRYLAARNALWRSEDFDSYKFIQALKGKELNGWCYVPVNSVKKRLSNQNLASAIDWFSIFAVNYLAKKRIVGPVFVVPIPNSSCTASSSAKPFTRKLASAIRERLGDQGTLLDCLRWKKNLGSASKEGGPRDVETLYGNLVLTANANEEMAIVLVDDVMTSGGHLKACAAKLRAEGAKVRIAVCAGRTTYDQGKPAFCIVEETLDDHET